jgi:AraC-like DNA-binding protein
LLPSWHQQERAVTAGPAEQRKSSDKTEYTLHGVQATVAHTGHCILYYINQWRLPLNVRLLLNTPQETQQCCDATGTNTPYV